ncbi:MAG: hypothetical protein JW832_01720 [Deltaproteobacteria bacterium]|nr:hypothetical protein [Deltaproteobacteria bacterium]
MFHIVFFIVAINFLFDCPAANAFARDTLQLRCSVSPASELKKKYCQSHFKQDISPLPVLPSPHDLFSFPASSRFCVHAAFPLVNIPTPFETSVRLNL